MNFIELKQKLASSEFDILIGLVEDEHFDAKSGKYDLSSDGGRLELAKDVSSFANRSGGIIVIGAKTTDDPSFYGRRIESISVFPFSLINPPDYHNVIKDWMYPRPDNTEIEWVPSKNESDKGLVYIFIPDQPQNLRPFLIKKDIDPTTNRKRKEILFGYVE
jgi:predicted HTH transcriptional regulator